VEISEGQLLCVVCNDIGNGVHFGAVTCEGCKVSIYVICSILLYILNGWLGGVVVSVSYSRLRGPGFDSRPVHRQAIQLWASC